MHQDKQEENDEGEVKKTAKAQTIVSRQIESVVVASFAALNNHNFDLTTPPWTCFSKHYRNDPSGPAPNLSTYSDYPILSNSDSTDLHGVVSFFRTLAETCPGYQTIVTEISTSELDLEAGYGSVMVSAESHGIPPGVTRSSVSSFEFRREKREWMCVRQRTLPGIEYVPGG
ncbi:hypothetical protein M409DRAFT_57948 [Zasmidium cellare ATCC 36951]|uniref:SnoaL-like domain-containing protein n=1 Tax=Zasmidium cellare ATCC 36951 TaxID=1080233 RepID=A0A6A6C6T6_ZASCE|nr:uncharacterized protein M409DRAFT_57948 [Zasmidium cellare ATCC 36951]KAF2162897.1 hypothetical protein M409DRAFT_57948 [Zasmidium cellare ATCC 36951]